MKAMIFFPLWLSLATVLAGVVGAGVALDLRALIATNPTFNMALLGLWGLGVALFCLPALRLQRDLWALNRSQFARLGLLQPVVVLAQRNPLASRQQVLSVLDRCADTLGFYGARYIGGALIFVGLIGTLWGLSRTILDIAEVIGNLPAQGISEELFGALKSQLKRPLQGMGMAFSSSLFGVAGSVILNFINMQVDRATDRFFQQAEHRLLRLFKQADAPLSGVPQAQPGSEWAQALQNYLTGLDRIDDTVRRLDQRHADLVQTNATLASHLLTLTDLMRTQQTALTRWAEEQLASRHSLERLSQHLGEAGLASQEAMRKALLQTAQATQGVYQILSQGGLHTLP